MKLRKATRKRLYEAAAKKEAITIAWPASAPEPVPGHKYPVKGFDPETRLVVEKRKELKDEHGDTGRFEAIVRLDHDPVRLLWGLAPTRSAEGDLEPEPEGVPRPYQRLLASEGAIKTAMQGNLHRQQNKVYERERRLRDEFRPSRSQKAQVRHLRSQRAHLRGSEAA